MKYTELKKQIADKIGAFEMFFAFSNEQLAQGMEKIGVTDKSEIVSVGSGAFMRRAKVQEYKDLLKEVSKQERDFLEESEENFYSAALYELNNHEYGYTGDNSDALDALGYEMKDLSPMQKTALRRAQDYIMANTY
jgi:hypothetical protein